MLLNGANANGNVLLLYHHVIEYFSLLYIFLCYVILTFNHNYCLFLTVRPGSPINDEASGKDFKYVLIEKDNVPLKKESERLIMAKDTGKQFMSAAPTTVSGNFKYFYLLCIPHYNIV